MGTAPRELDDLLRATTPGARDAAWARFADRFSPLLLHTARATAHDRDQAMDAYAFVLEQLRADDARRLRGYTEDPRSQFTTWLVVVARRLCLDHQRRRYGRVRRENPAARDEHVRRRRLADLIGVELEEGADVPDPGVAPDLHVRRADQLTALRECVAGLPGPQRLLLTMRFEDDRPVREITALLRYPTPFHVYRALNAALARLRECLGRRGVSDPDP